MKVTASDADDPTYGSSARVVYSVLDGEMFFTVDRHTGKNDKDHTFSTACLCCILFFNAPFFSTVPKAISSSETILTRSIKFRET